MGMSAAVPEVWHALALCGGACEKREAEPLDSVNRKAHRHAIHNLYTHVLFLFYP